MKAKKKILYIVEAFGGGVFTYLVELTNQLCDEYDIYIAYGLRKQTPHDFKKYFNKNIKFIKVENFTRSLSIKDDTKAFFEIKHIYKEVQPDIVHLNSSKAGALGRFAINGKKVPVLYTPHGYSFLMKNYSSKKRIIFKLIERICAMRTSTTVSCSLGEHKATLGLTKHALYVNNGIDINELNRLINQNKSQVHATHPFTVFTLGRISYQKNPQLFNEIAQKLPNVKFIWIGDGEQRDLLTSSNIEITGWLDRESALIKAMNADSFLLTSLWEGLPMSLLEAMYLKKLCIVSNVIGNRDVIKNDINGYICNDVNEYVDCISNAQNQLNKRILDNAYKDIIKEYNTETMTKRYNEIYDRYINN